MYSAFQRNVLVNKRRLYFTGWNAWPLPILWGSAYYDSIRISLARLLSIMDPFCE
jgi:hypothetical protein